MKFKIEAKKENGEEYFNIVLSKSLVSSTKNPSTNISWDERARKEDIARLLESSLNNLLLHVGHTYSED